MRRNVHNELEYFYDINYDDKTYGEAMALTFKVRGIHWALMWKNMCGNMQLLSGMPTNPFEHRAL